MKIVYICDNNYIKYLNMSIESVLKYNSMVDIVVVSNKPLDIKHKNIVYNPAQEFLSQLRFNAKERLTELTYYKLLLPEIFSNDDKIIYIDCDTLCQKSLNNIWHMDCQYICLTEHYLPFKYPNNQKHGLAGFMIMNLKALREDNFKEKCMQNMDYPQDFWGHEESLINLNYQGKLTYIDKKYHYCKGRSRLYKNPIQEKDAYILHYPAITKRLMSTDFEKIMKEVEK